MTSEPAELRPGTVDDLDGILKLQRGSKTAPQWSRALWTEALENGSSEIRSRAVFVMASGSNVGGFIAVACVAGIAEIESIVVSPETRSQGIGTALCRRAMVWAREHGGEQVELEVRSSNVAAEGLYRSLGFAVQGVRVKYYRDPPEDALLMVLQLR